MLAIMYKIMYILLMNMISISEFRRKLARMIDTVTADHEPLLITREGGKASAVLVSLEDFASYEETQHLLKSPQNAARLAQSIKALDEGRGRKRKLAG